MQKRTLLITCVWVLCLEFFALKWQYQLFLKEYHLWDSRLHYEFPEYWFSTIDCHIQCGWYFFFPFLDLLQITIRIRQQKPMNSNFECPEPPFGRWIIVSLGLRIGRRTRPLIIPIIIRVMIILSLSKICGPFFLRH